MITTKELERETVSVRGRALLTGTERARGLAGVSSLSSLARAYHNTKKERKAFNSLSLLYHYRKEGRRGIEREKERERDMVENCDAKSTQTSPVMDSTGSGGWKESPFPVPRSRSRYLSLQRLRRERERLQHPSFFRWKAAAVALLCFFLVQTSLSLSFFGLLYLDNGGGKSSE